MGGEDDPQEQAASGPVGYPATTPGAAGAAPGEAKKSTSDKDADVPESSLKLNLILQAKDKGTDFYKNQQFASARDKWQEALDELMAMDMESSFSRIIVSLHLNLGQAALQLKEYDDTVGHMSSVLEYDPENFKAFYRRGLANDALGRAQAAAADLQKAARLEPMNAEIRKKYEELKQKAKEAEERGEDDEPPKHDINKLPRAFIDVAIGDRGPQRLVFALYTDSAPKTCENFRQLCTGEHQGTTARGKPFHYKGCLLHRMIPGLMIQGGDFDNANGTGGESIYGRRFQDEALKDKFKRRGLLAMANDGPHTNGSNFFVTFAEADHLDRRHVIFGEVVSGHPLLDELEKLPTDPECRPLTDCRVTDCGECGPGGTTTAGPAPS